MAIEFDIKEHFGVLSEKKTGWCKEVNLVSWGKNSPKYDIREWDPDHEKMGKGVTLTREELRELYRIIKSIFEEDTLTSENTDSPGGALSIEDILNSAR